MKQGDLFDDEEEIQAETTYRKKPQSLAAASEEFFDRLSNARPGEKIHCPCCKGDFAIRKRRLNSGMAMSLIFIYKETLTMRYTDDWICIPKVLNRQGMRNREYTRLRHWELLEPHPTGGNRDAEENSQGIWRITDLGKRFVRMEDTVAASIRVFRNRVLRYSKHQITIKDALGTEFDYQEILGV